MEAQTKVYDQGLIQVLVDGKEIAVYNEVYQAIELKDAINEKNIDAIGLEIEHFKIQLTRAENWNKKCIEANGREFSANADRCKNYQRYINELVQIRERLEQNQ